MAHLHNLAMQEITLDQAEQHGELFVLHCTTTWHQPGLISVFVTFSSYNFWVEDSEKYRPKDLNKEAPSWS
jgi:hypothetical protein